MDIYESTFQLFVAFIIGQLLANKYHELEERVNMLQMSIDKFCFAQILKAQ